MEYSRRVLKSQFKVLVATLGVLWVVFILTWISNGSMLALGVIPRTTLGLRGILFAPLLHGSFAHLLTNSIPFIILGWLVMLRDSRHFVSVTIMSTITSGLFAWLFGASGSVHVGASGVIFGYLGFLMLAGWYSRSVGSILLSVIVTLLWGGMVIGVMPGQAGISWQAHLGGFLGGALAARAYRTTPADLQGFAHSPHRDDIGA